MPEPPDFEQIARSLIYLVEADVREAPFPPDKDPATAELIARCAEQLRQVWNARGAADLAVLQQIAGPADRDLAMAEDVIPALRRLDR